MPTRDTDFDYYSLDRSLIDKTFSVLFLKFANKIWQYY